MTHPKYSLPEVERRWLVETASLPEFDIGSATVISDLYLSGTRLRLRRMDSPGEAPIFKLVKKYGKVADHIEPITNLYLTEAEWRLLDALPGLRVRKQRIRYAGGSLDIYSELEPRIVLFEVEFSSEETAAAYSPPPFAGREITGDPECSGHALAGLS